MLEGNIILLAALSHVSAASSQCENSFTTELKAAISVESIRKV